MSYTVFAALFVAVPAAAACLNPAPDDAQAVAAAVVGGDPRVFFVKDSNEMAGCPNGSAACRAKAYVMNGDVVVATISQGGYRCATFTGPRGTSTTNWLPAAVIAPLAPKPPAFDDWIGRWVVGEQQITITSGGKGGALSLKGTATYGGFDPARVRRGAVNMGDFDAVVTPDGTHIAFTVAGDTIRPYDEGDPMDCRLRLSVIGPYLIVADNDNCGGHNVTFSGVYRRKV
jgi:hypothetical protein